MSDVTLMFTGDTILQRRVSPSDEKEFLRAVDAIRSTDAGFTNLEGCIQTGEDWHAYLAGNGRGATFIRTPPYVGDELEWMGMRLISLANNHSADFGESGFLTTLRHLGGSPALRAAGVGATLAEAAAPTYLETPRAVVAMIAAADYGPRGFGELAFPPPLGVMAADADRYYKGRPGLNLLRYDCRFTIPEASLDHLRQISSQMGWDETKAMRVGGGGRAEPMAGPSPATDEVDGDGVFYFMGRKFQAGDEPTFVTGAYAGDVERIVAAVHEARRQADWVVVSLHQQGAGRSRAEPTDHAVALGRAAMAAGADVFVAHGAGRVGGIELVDDRVAIYGQGSFIMHLDQVKQFPLEMMHRFGYGYDNEAGELLERRAANESRVGTEVGTRAEPVRHLSSMTLVELRSGQRPQTTVLPIALGSPHDGRFASGVPGLLAPGSDAHGSAVDMIAKRSAPYGTIVAPDGEVGPA